MAPQEPKVQRATVHRPNENGVDLPAGKWADELTPTDYRPVEIDADADEDAGARVNPPSEDVDLGRS